MIRACALFAALVGLAGCAPMDVVRASPAERTAVDLIAGSYTFGVGEAPLVGCRVTLDAALVRRAAGYTTRSVTFSSACGERFAAPRAIRQWARTGGGSIALFGGDPAREVGHFSPVQDGTGVYLRGGFEVDAAVYELRQSDP